MEEKELKQEALIPSAITEGEMVEFDEERRVDWKELLKYLEVQKEAFKKYRIICIGYTRDKDWVMIDGQPFLQESGAQAIAGPMGVSIGAPTFTKEWSEDGKGKYYIYTCQAEIIAKTFHRQMGAVGICTSRDRFFSVKGGELKDIEDIDERNIKMKSYTNMVNNGIKRILGMRNIDIQELIRAGIDISNVQKVDHKLAGKKTGASERAIEEAKKATLPAETEFTPAQIELSQNLAERIFKVSTLDDLKTVWQEDETKRRSLPKKLFNQIVIEKDKKKEWLQKQTEENKNEF